MVFSHGAFRGIEPPDHSSEIKQDRLTADGFAKLVELSNPLLVVLATCNALYTASRVSRFANVVAASGDIAVDVIVGWQKAFYGGLGAGQSLFNSYELANAVSTAPVVLHLKKDFVVAGD